MALDHAQWDALVALGNVYLQRERFALAEQAYRQSLAQRRTLLAQTNLGAALAQQGRLLEAKEEFQAVLRVDPKDARTALGLRLCDGQLQP